VHARLTRVVAKAKLLHYSGNKLVIPGLREHNMSLDKKNLPGFRSKTIHLGSYCSSRGGSLVTQIKVSICKVSSTDGGRKGFEVAGTSSQVNAAAGDAEQGCCECSATGRASRACGQHAGVCAGCCGCSGGGMKEWLHNGVYVVCVAIGSRHCWLQCPWYSTVMASCAC
jgi:hypothetical protein